MIISNVQYDISIHTPTRGVTCDCCLFFDFDIISIHTPTRGVTSFSAIMFCITKYFNPHSHKGSDTASMEQLLMIVISIHTPTRGVTKNKNVKCKSSVYFNPHSHKGSDKPSRSFTSSYVLFQSTLPQGE